MRKLLGLSLLLVILLAACGNKVDGKYVNKKEHVTLVANDEKKTARLIVEPFGAPVEIKGKIDTDKKAITFEEDGESLKFNYEFDKEQLVLYEEKESKKKGIKLDKEE